MNLAILNRKTDELQEAIEKDDTKKINEIIADFKVDGIEITILPSNVNDVLFESPFD